MFVAPIDVLANHFYPLYLIDEKWTTRGDRGKAVLFVALQCLPVNLHLLFSNSHQPCITGKPRLATWAGFLCFRTSALSDRLFLGLNACVMGWLGAQAENRTQLTRLLCQSSLSAWYCPEQK